LPRPGRPGPAPAAGCRRRSRAHPANRMVYPRRRALVFPPGTAPRPLPGGDSPFVTDRTLAENLDRVRTAVSAAAARAGRDPQTIRVIAVTKTVPLARIREAVALGLRTFGATGAREAVAQSEVRA